MLGSAANPAPPIDDRYRVDIDIQYVARFTTAQLHLMGARPDLQAYASAADLLLILLSRQAGMLWIVWTLRPWHILRGGQDVT